MIEKLQYITQDHPEKSHLDLCREACEAGVRWVQLRIKNQPDEVYLEMAKSCREITKAYKAMLIINDELDVALESGADGVHLGQNDMDTKEARQRVGKGFIIGGTANTLEQANKHAENGVDYVGVGPFRFTQTKKNLSPVLGLEGYKGIVSRVNKQIPIIAVGGIVLEDLIHLKKIGIYGVAVSGLITKDVNKQLVITKANEVLNQ